MDNQTPEAGSQAMRIRVLHVEDNEIDALATQKLLEIQTRASIVPTRAASLDEARDALKNERFDLVLLDLNLPDAVDLDALRALRPEKPETPPIIVLTSAGYEDAGLLSLQAGAQDFLAKADLTGDGLARAILNAHERRRLETALRRERDQARKYLDIVPVIILALDQDARVISINRAGCEVLGGCEGDIVGAPWIERFIPEADRDATRKYFEDALRGESGREFRENRILCLNGETPVISWRNVVMRDGSGKAIGILSSGENVTDKRRAEENVKYIKERLEMALDAAGIGMWDWFVKTGETLFDARWQRMLGFSPGELPGNVSTWENRLHPDDKPHVMETLRRHNARLTDMYQEEFRLKTKSGKWKWILALGKVNERDEKDAPVRMTGIHMDIDERMRLTEARDWETRVNEALSRLYRQLTVTNPGLDIVSSALLEEAKTLIGAGGGLCVTVNRESKEIENHAYGEEWGAGCGVEGEKRLDPALGKDGPYPGLWGYALNTGEAFYDNVPSTHPASTGLPPGHAPLINFLAVPALLGERRAGLIALSNKEGGFTERDLAAVREMGRYYGVAIQRVEAQAALSKSEERYRSLVESMQEGIIMLDQDARLNYVNHQICKMLGRSRQDIMGTPLLDLVHESNRDEFVSQFAKRREGHADRYELILKHAEGHKVFTLIAPTPLFDEAGNFQGSFGVVTNVTKLKLLESQLVQAQKLESIGQLAAGIAHEINTPTQYVDNNVRYLKDGVDSLLDVAMRCREFLEAASSAASDEKKRELESAVEKADVEYLATEMPDAANDALEGLERIAEIVRSVKQLAHPGKPEMELMDINEAVASAVTVSRNEWKYAADLETDFDESLPLTSCIRGEFSQVILNLIVNAAQAIQEKIGEHPEVKGRIWVSTKNTGDGVEIRVKDTGGGIPKAIQSKIFDPFFTTKEVGKGTGQGLAISHNVVREKHGGEILLESEEGQGAAFIVWLPFEREGSKEAGR